MSQAAFHSCVRGLLCAVCLAAPVALAAPLTRLASFPERNEAAQPLSLIWVGGSTYVGTASLGASEGDGGALFAFDSDSGTLSPLASLNTGELGSLPVAPLLATRGGATLGLSAQGGERGFGVLYRFNAAESPALIPLVAFSDRSDGREPLAGLVELLDGRLYGLASRGGDGGGGVVFELIDDGLGGVSLTPLASFDGSNGRYPETALLAAGELGFLGTTTQGGKGRACDDPGAGVEGCGAIYRFLDGDITMLASFEGANGQQPLGLTAGEQAGIFYGVTARGGDNDLGGVFEFNVDDATITLKASFRGANGRYPSSGLVSAGHGLYYGTTAAGGSGSCEGGCGVVFAYDSNSGEVVSVASFEAEGDGRYPRGLVAAPVTGLYYGITMLGGEASQGTLFSFSTLGPEPPPDPGPVVITPTPGPLPLLGVGEMLVLAAGLRRRQRRVAAVRR